MWKKPSLLTVMFSLVGSQENVTKIKESVSMDISNMQQEFFSHLALTIMEINIKQEELIRINSVNEAKIKDLERRVSYLQNPPKTFECGYSSLAKTKSEVISYTKLLYSSTNIEGAGLDVSTGVFTSGQPGTYSATWSLSAWNDAGDARVFVYLRKNRNIIEESQHYTHYTGDSGAADDVGGRTLFLHLDRGDTLDLFCDDCSAYVNFITFCITLSHDEVE